MLLDSERGKRRFSLLNKTAPEERIPGLAFPEPPTDLFDVID